MSISKFLSNDYTYLYISGLAKFLLGILKYSSWPIIILLFRDNISSFVATIIEKINQSSKVNFSVAGMKLEIDNVIAKLTSANNIEYGDQENSSYDITKLSYKSLNDLIDDSYSKFESSIEELYKHVDNDSENRKNWNLFDKLFYLVHDQIVDNGIYEESVTLLNFYYNFQGHIESLDKDKDFVYSVKKSFDFLTNYLSSIKT